MFHLHTAKITFLWNQDISITKYLGMFSKYFLFDLLKLCLVNRNFQMSLNSVLTSKINYLWWKKHIFARWIASFSWIIATLVSWWRGFTTLDSTTWRLNQLELLWCSYINTSWSSKQTEKNNKAFWGSNSWCCLELKRVLPSD